MQRVTIPVVRGRFGSPMSRVLEQLRGQGLALRDEIGQSIGLSPATVARSVRALMDAGLVRERPDQTRLGTIGRPSVPVELVTDGHVFVGVHVGTLEVTVALADLGGRVLDSLAFDRVPGRPPDLGRVGAEVMMLLRQHGHRLLVSAGLVGPWRELGLDVDLLRASLEEELGLPTATADHVAAIAAAEFIQRRHGTTGISAYLYARNSGGFVLAVDNGVQTEISRVGGLQHFPTGSSTRCWCGRLGCFDVTVTDDAVAHSAVEQGLVVEPRIEAVRAAAVAGSEGATDLLRERARRLGTVAAAVRDMTDPDRVILVGQGFTGYSPVVPDIVAAFDAATMLAPTKLSFTRFGSDVQAIAACTIAVGPVYDDPMIVTRPIAAVG